MRTAYDAFGKGLLVSLLEAFGETRTEEEVANEPQRIDVWFSPAEKQAELQYLGLLGRMLARRCMIEPFHDPPSTDEIRECIHKQVAWERSLSRRGQQKSVPAPLLWIVSAGNPKKAVAQLGFEQAAGWPMGVQTLERGWRAYLVVVSCLPRTRETLILRLLGAGQVLREAIRELRALPAGAVERKCIEPVLVRTGVAILCGAEKRSQTEEAFLMETRDLVDKYLNDIREQERKAAQEKIQAAERQIQTERRAALTAEQRAKAGTLLRQMEKRFGLIPPRVHERVGQASVEQLDDWLDRVLDAESIEDVLCAVH